MKLIVGLGNPGKEYENTRHNAGFRFIDSYIKAKKLTFDKEKFQGKYTKYNDIIFLKPQKYMNLSGEVVKDFMNYFKINIEDLLVICDDLDTKLSHIKLKYKGSSAGHNGLKNIEQNLNTNNYKRIKIGIGSLKGDKINYVIGKVSKEELTKLNKPNKYAEKILDDYQTMSFDNLMNKYNSKEFQDELTR